MESQIIEKIANPTLEISPLKLKATYPHSRVKGRLITTKIVGVTFEGRQEVVARLQQGDLVWLEPEPDNPYDHNAIRVCRSNGEQIGYLNRNLAAKIIPYFLAYEYHVRGKVKLLIGGYWDDFALGVVIAFKLPKPRKLHNPHHDPFSEWEA